MAGVASEFEFGRAFGATFAILRQNGVLYFGLAVLVVALPTYACSWVVDQLIGKGVIDQSQPLGQLQATYLRLVATGLVGPFFTASVLTGAMGHFDGRVVSASDCVTAGLRHWLPLLALNWMTAVGVAFGFLLFFVPGIILSLAWFVVAPVRVVEGLPIMACFGRSADLTRGGRGLLFGFSIVVGLITFGISLVGSSVGGLVAATANATGGAPVDGRLIALPLTYVFTFPLSATAAASVYGLLAGRGREQEKIASVFS